ncbi:exosortase/archaeosortase family protein [Persicirhabdus sediminis]|uniref:Exosortase/archaeosortase family protein n=1 Tax=Persicirhabdus sediminis TaxID=454144 RepID=A0A8J7MKM0_9BACT|nr:exosortase/archaeosortase family protein [Persicirhabdus sediminis]MBK1792763.1 exosortase/archaeosortase family protein [Persicirhabdus sediminis]
MKSTKKNIYVFPVIILSLVVTYFLWIVPIYANTSTSAERLIFFMVDAWGGDFVHGWAVPVLFLVFVVKDWPRMCKQPSEGSIEGLIGVIFGIFLYVASVRTMQPRVALVGLPFLISGGVWFVFGWKVARYMLFPAFFWWFAVSVPGLSQATNFLQVWVTQACYQVGLLFGMDIINSGNDIRSATNSWNFDIAEGCSGIRSLMALVMIAAIYAYFTQKQLWKKALLFACAIPLAMLGNFLRIMTIIILAEMGFQDFASGVYHDWAGILFFFPIALAGLFGIDYLINFKANRKTVRTRKV